MSARKQDERGVLSLELAIVAPILIALMLLMVGLGRMALARQEVNAAAYEAARTASLERVVPVASSQGRQAAERTLAERGLSCSRLSVDVDTSGYQSGGQVTANVVCVAKLSDLAMAGLPGSKTYRATATVPIEQFRAER